MSSDDPTLSSSSTATSAPPASRNPTANDLRKAAEYADGHRNQNVYLVDRPSQIPGDDREGVIAVLEVDAGDKYLCTVQTQFTAPDSNMNLHPIDYVEARSGSLPPWQNLAERPTSPNDTGKWNFDSLFWSEAAIEKFLVPYYSSFFSKAEMDWFYSGYTDTNVFAVGHRVPTVYSTIKSGNGGGPPPPPEFSDAFHSLTLLKLHHATQKPEVISLAEYVRRKKANL